MLASHFHIIRESSDNPSILPPSARLSREADIRDAVDLDGLLAVQDKICRFMAGQDRLTGLQLYYNLELCTPLLLLNIILRKGSRNKYSNGLQQTYGDHTKLLLFGIDMLDSESDAASIDWYCRRRPSAGSVGIAEVSEVVAKYHSICFSRADKIALWLASALHDYGKLYRHGYGLDADDAVALCLPILDRLVDPTDRPLVEFCIRNHDYIEHLPAGETPVSFISDQLACMPSNRRRTALACLGLIQLAGAASLGEGRLTAWKTKIFELLVDGTLIDEASTTYRLARLLFGDQFFVDEEKRGFANERLESLDQDERGIVEEFLSKVVLHEWASMRDAAMAGRSSPEAIDASWLWIRYFATVWCRQGKDCEHIASSKSLLDSWYRDPNDVDLSHSRLRLLNGSGALVIQKGLGR